MTTEKEKAIPSQRLVGGINKEYETVATKKNKNTVLASYHLFEKVLDLVIIKEDKQKDINTNYQIIIIN